MVRGKSSFMFASAAFLRARFVHGETIRGLERKTNETTTLALSGDGTFQIGDLLVNIPALGIRICTGMSVKRIARANHLVQLTASGRESDYSNLTFHSMPDGAGVFPTDDNGGYVYVSNSEMKEKLGGVYGLYFDGEGNVADYKNLLSGTTRNCGGGRTPWETWISCEEYGLGQCWQVDPTNQRPPKITKLGGNGGSYESVAVDDRNSSMPIFYVSEDHESGALRRYTPPVLQSKVTGSTIATWHTVTADGGKTEYLVFLNANQFQWTTDEQVGRDSQFQYYPNVEGIHYHDRHLLFVSKKLLTLFILDLDGGTYTSSSTKYGVLPGGGDWSDQPDQFTTEGAYMYYTEDGGDTVGVYAIHRLTGERYAIFEAYDDIYKHDETTGLAFSPDKRKMYAAFQDCGCDDSDDGVDYSCGCLLEFSRRDGYSFDGSTPSLKFHSPNRWVGEVV